MDFQVSKYTSPAIDLLHFCNVSLSDEMTDDDVDIVLRQYLTTLCETMNQIGCKTPLLTLEKLYQELKNHAVYGMVITLTILPLMLDDKSDSMLLDEIEILESTKYPCLKSARFRQILMKRLPVFDKMGLLDL